ncbi:hypothetical protein QQ045_007422 [Rhodiola kirilowii]
MSLRQETRRQKSMQVKYKGKYTFIGAKAVGWRNLFDIPWSLFMAENSPFFINGILHLRAELNYQALNNKFPSLLFVETIIGVFMHGSI